jgi:hypothetical protein
MNGGNVSTIWVQSPGGPHLILPRSALPFWRGARPDTREEDVESIEQSGHFYAAADVAADSEVGLLPVGSEVALVLGRDPIASCWITHRGFSGGVVERAHR